jgi:adenosine deaminase
MNNTEIITHMPKVELHLHLEGAFTLEFLLTQIQTYDRGQAFASLAELQKRFILRDFNHFIETWCWKNQFFRSAQDFERSTYQTLADLSRQNVVHVEAFFSPWDFAANGIVAPEIIDATIAGKLAAERDFGISCFLIADLDRDLGHQTAGDRLNDVKKHRDTIVAIGLGGNESRYPAHLYADVFDAARRNGFHCVAHAGEAAGAGSIRAALNLLQAERIGHGITAMHDPELMEELRRRQIPLEISLTSNIMTKVVKDLAHHPVRRFYQEGLLVTINSDDPTMFNSTLTNEYQLLHDRLDFRLNDLRQLTINAAHASFLASEEKNRILQSIDRFWQTVNFNQEM